MKLTASALSVSGVRQLPFLKPIAIALAMLMLPPELPIIGRFSLTPKADAQITVCGRQATIFQVCTTASNNFETEARSDYEKQYNLKPGDGNLIYTYGRADLRMSFRTYMFNKLLAAARKAPTDRSSAEQGMISYFQGLVQQHEIAEYTAATADRDQFLQHTCQWVPDTDIEKAYKQTINLGPYCSAGVPNLSTLFNGPPDMPTIDYFVAKGYKAAYQQPLEASTSGTAASGNAYPGGAVAALTLQQLQIAELSGVSAVSAQSTGVIVSSQAIPALNRAIFLTRSATQVIKAKSLGTSAANLLKAASTAVRVFGAVSIALEVVTTVVSVVFAILDAEGQKNEIDTLNADLANATNNLPDLVSFMNDSAGPGFDKLTSVFLELTLPEYESVAALPSPAASDPQFVTNSSSVRNLVGAITYQDQNNQILTAQPYSQNWMLVTGRDQNGNAINRFSNYLTYVGPDTSNNKVAYKAWINNGSFTVAKLVPNSTDQVCAAGSNGLYQGDTPSCASFTPDHLTMLDVDGNPMNITMSQALVYDSPSPANVAFTTGVGGTVFFQAHGIPTPSSMSFSDPLPAGCGLSDVDTSQPGVGRLEVSCPSLAPASSVVSHLSVSNGASSISVPVTFNIEDAVHITSPTNFTVTYGVPVNFVITATGSQVHFDVATGAFPDGLTFTDDGKGTETITGTPVASGKLIGCFEIGSSTCNVTVSNAVSSDNSPLQVTIITPPAPQFTSPQQVTFRDTEYSEFVVSMSGAVTSSGATVYSVFDACPASVPSWLTKTIRPNGDLFLSGTPPFFLNDQTYNLAFGYQLGTSPVFYNCQNVPYRLTIKVQTFPIFPSPPFLIALPGAAVPSNNFQMGSSFNSISAIGNLPAGVSFNSDSAEYFFTGTLPSNTEPGDYRLTINANIINNSNVGSQMFDFIVAQAPHDDGFKTFNLVVNQPANLLINPGGFPKNGGAGAPSMTAALNMVLPLQTGLQQQPGPMSGSVAITGTPTQTGRALGVFAATNGIAPDLEEFITIHVINPGDINADGHVDCSDVSMVKSALNMKLGFPGYSNLADVNSDGIVNAQDLALVAKYLTPGTKCQ